MTWMKGAVMVMMMMAAVSAAADTKAADALCQQYAPSSLSRPEALKTKHCDESKEMTANRRKLCHAIVGSQGHASSGVGEWSGTLTTFQAPKKSPAMGSSGEFFLQFCVNPSTNASNPKDVLCSVVDVNGSVPFSVIPGYEIFVVQTVTNEVRTWGAPSVVDWGNQDDYCRSIHCFDFDQYGDIRGEHFQMQWAFSPICYANKYSEIDDKCVDKDAPISLPCASLGGPSALKSLDRPQCASPGADPQFSCDLESNCPCKDKWGCERHLASPEPKTFIASTNPHGRPKGHVFLTQEGSLTTYCGAKQVKTKLQGYMNPSWNADNYYGGLPMWLSAVLCVALGGLFFLLWVIFFWSAGKKKTVIDDDDEDWGDDEEQKRDEDMENTPFIVDNMPRDVIYRCPKCSERIENLAEECFCPGCGDVLNQVLVVDPSTNSARIRKNGSLDSQKLQSISAYTPA